ncbi:MAG: ATP-binding protein [Nanoarchaeota archaeon]
MYKRKLYYKIKAKIEEKEIIVVTGMRRVGKTTLLKMIFDEIKSGNKIFLDIENPLNQKIFEEEDYDNIWANLKPLGIDKVKKAYIFIDEVQLKPDITKVIKYLYDHYDVKFFLTGSSSFYLKNLFPESLAGRKVIFELFPLDFEEFLVFKEYEKRFYPELEKKDSEKNKIEYEKMKKLYEEYLEFGGFPQVVLADGIEKKKEFLIDVFKSYFEKDVQILADFREIRAFRDLLLLLLKRIGSKLEITKLSSEIGVSRETIYSYLSFLEKTYFISLISPYTKSVDREISKTRKIYVCDNGIAKYIGNCGDGSLLENSVFHNLRKYGDIRYYQKRTGAEIDFILDGKIALEIKNKGNSRDYLKLKKLAERLGIKECYVITREYSDEKSFIPAQDI